MDHQLPRRVEFFRVPVDREAVPVGVFKPTDALDASAGLVLALGDGELQVLTAAEDEPQRPAYGIELLLGEDTCVPRFCGHVTRIWTRESGTGWISGLRFDGGRSAAEAFVRVYLAEAIRRPACLRCLLVAPATPMPGSSARSGHSR